MSAFTQTATGAAMPTSHAENPLWKVARAVAAEIHADDEEDDGEDSYDRHVKFESRMGNFV